MITRVRIPSEIPKRKVRRKRRKQHRKSCPRRLARPRTPPSQGENTGSNPVGDAKFKACCACARVARKGKRFDGRHRQETSVSHCANSGRGTGCATTASAWLVKSKPRIAQRNPQGEVAISLGQVWGVSGCVPPPVKTRPRDRHLFCNSSSIGESAALIRRRVPEGRCRFESYLLHHILGR